MLEYICDVVASSKMEIQIFATIFLFSLYLLQNMDDLASFTDFSFALPYIRKFKKFGYSPNARFFIRKIDKLLVHAFLSES